MNIDATDPERPLVDECLALARARYGTPVRISVGQAPDGMWLVDVVRDEFGFPREHRHGAKFEVQLLTERAARRIEAFRRLQCALAARSQ